MWEHARCHLVSKDLNCNPFKNKLDQKPYNVGIKSIKKYDSQDKCS